MYGAFSHANHVLQYVYMCMCASVFIYYIPSSVYIYIYICLEGMKMSSSHSIAFHWIIRNFTESKDLMTEMHPISSNNISTNDLQWIIMPGRWKLRILPVFWMKPDTCVDILTQQANDVQTHLIKIFIILAPQGDIRIDVGKTKQITILPDWHDLKNESLEAENEKDNYIIFRFHPKPRHGNHDLPEFLGTKNEERFVTFRMLPKHQLPWSG